MKTRRFSVLNEDDGDPMLSTINLVDVFLVAMVMLMMAVVRGPSMRTADEDSTLIRNAGKPTMEIVVKQGETLTKFSATGLSGEGNGTVAGTAYRMNDGTMVYVPSNNATSNKEPN